MLFSKYVSSSKLKIKLFSKIYLTNFELEAGLCDFRNVFSRKYEFCFKISIRLINIIYYNYIYTNLLQCNSRKETFCYVFGSIIYFVKLLLVLKATEII